MYSSLENLFSNDSILEEGDDAYTETMSSTELLSRKQQDNLTLDCAYRLHQRGTLDRRVEAFNAYTADREITGESLGFSFGRFVA